MEREKSAEANVKTIFSDSKTRPGKLKVEMKYQHYVRNKHYSKLNKTTVIKFLEAINNIPNMQ